MFKMGMGKMQGAGRVVLVRGIDSDPEFVGISLILFLTMSQTITWDRVRPIQHMQLLNSAPMATMHHAYYLCTFKRLFYVLCVDK